ncbi:ATP synthase F1 subunit gamma [Chloroflexota bacterium]
MAVIRLIRKRIRSIQSTAKITRAMEMIATARMRRAQLQALAARPYAEKMSQVLADLATQQEDTLHPLLTNREVKHIAVLHITPDRGLCGGLNSNISRHAAAFILEQRAPVTLITAGRKGRDFMFRRGQDIRAEFSGISDRPSLADTLPISRVVIDDYVDGFVDQIYLCYAEFISTTVQRPVLQQLLPIEPAQFEPGQTVEYIYEPSSIHVLDQLLPRYVEMQVYHAILESIASEHSARMVAMRNATDNAKEMIEELTLTYNKVRQEMITNELLDISGGVAAQE